MFDLTKDEIDIIVDSLEFHIEGCRDDFKRHKEYIMKMLAIRNLLKGQSIKSVIVNCNLEIKTPFTTKKEAEEFAKNYELPKEYVENSFELIKIINSD